MHRYRVSLVAAVAALATVTGPAFAGGCPDINGDDQVDFSDLLELLANWGPCVGCAADLDGSGEVDFNDLLELLANWGPCPVESFTSLELAGNALTSYPFMEYVRAMNTGAPVFVGIDPSQHPAIVGALGFVYVVDAKTAAEWDGNPTLTDVRGGAQPFLFGGPDVQDSTLFLTGVFDPGTDIVFGRGYDVVIDIDGDGTLSGGDYIDGYGDVAGFYSVRDTTQSGPLAVTEIIYSGGSFLGQDTYYPTDIATMGQLPLIVISHGNGHQYTWYDYLGFHLASYGYIVMSHQNNTVPGIETASTTTLTNTDYILGNQATIGGGVLNGHIDDSRITWVGHSRGGEGVARAYDRLVDGTYNATNFTEDNIVLISSIAPTDFLGPNSANPHGVDYHLLYGAADGDVSGQPDCNICQSFHLLERATGNRASTYVQGADHNDFNCCGFNDYAGPSSLEIGRNEAQRVTKGAYLALIKHFIDGAPAAKDFLWRQYESIRPIAVASTTIVDNEYKDGPGSGKFVIDSFQTQFATGTSSSLGSVTGTVSNRSEGRLDDNNSSFTWLTSDPMNGMTRGSSSDSTRGTVFDYDGADVFLEFEVVAAGQDFTAYDYLSFRFAQGTRHPNTIDAGDRTFDVSIRDGSGTTSTINIGAYLGGVERPFPRTGSGSGTGWQNEFETIRIRIDDFLTNGSGIDPADIRAVRFDFGPGHGSNRARLGLDDLELTPE